MRPLKLVFRCLSAALLVFAPWALRAADGTKPSVWELKPWPVSHYSARAGGFWAVNNTDIGLGTDRNPYSILDLDNDLGMNRNTASVMLNLNARFGKHHRVDLSYYFINRRSTTVLDKDIHFGDHDYTIDTQVDAWLNTNILRASYGFAFVSNPHVEAGALLGVHILGFGLGMSATGQSSDLDLDDRANFTAPLPDLGLWGTWAFHSRWALNAEMGFFAVRIKDIWGRLVSGNFSVQYRIGDHWGADLGYTFFRVKVNLDGERLQSNLKWSYNGPSLMVSYRFGNR